MNSVISLLQPIRTALLTACSSALLIWLVIKALPFIIKGSFFKFLAREVPAIVVILGITTIGLSIANILY